MQKKELIKSKYSRYAAIIISIVLLAVFGCALLLYINPIQSTEYDLSLQKNEYISDEDWIYDKKGWSVFTKDGESPSHFLEADNKGGFTGLSKDTDTVYYQRTIIENVENPVLELKANNAGFTVFLDDEIVYTDFPERDNRIGYIRLSPVETERFDPLEVYLPDDIMRKTLTVAQSTDPYLMDGKEPIFKPALVRLYSGFSSESFLISTSFKIAFTSLLGFIAGAVLLLCFIYQVYSKKDPLPVFLMALSFLLFSAFRIFTAGFSNNYTGYIPVNMQFFLRYISMSVLFFFLACMMGKPRKQILLSLAGIQAVSIILELAVEVFYIDRLLFLWTMPVIITDILIIVSLIFAVCEVVKKNFFFKTFGISMIIATALKVLYLLVNEDAGFAFITTLKMGYYTQISYDISYAMSISSFFGFALTFLKWEKERREDAEKLQQMNEMTKISFDELRNNNERIQMLRHDMMKHLNFLRQASSEESVISYIDELIGQQQAVRTVVRTGNKTFDIIINSKIFEAQQRNKDLTVEIVRAYAPEVVNMSEADFVSLLMNIMDNAVKASTSTGAENPYIKLDAHVKSDFFVLVCENSYGNIENEKDKGHSHGLGLKIIKQILEDSGGMLDIENKNNIFRITAAVSLKEKSSEK